MCQMGPIHLDPIYLVYPIQLVYPIHRMTTNLPKSCTRAATTTLATRKRPCGQPSAATRATTRTTSGRTK